MLHEALELRRLLVNTTWSEKRSIEDSEQNSTILYPMLDLNIQNRAIFLCNLQHKTGKRRGEEDSPSLNWSSWIEGHTVGWLDSLCCRPNVKAHSYWPAGFFEKWITCPAIFWSFSRTSGPNIFRTLEQFKAFCRSQKITWQAYLGLLNGTNREWKAFEFLTFKAIFVSQINTFFSFILLGITVM